MGMQLNHIELMRHYQSLDLQNSGKISATTLIRYLVTGKAQALSTTLETMSGLRDWDDKEKIYLGLATEALPFYASIFNHNPDQWSLYVLNQHDKGTNQTILQQQQNKEMTFQIPSNANTFATAWKQAVPEVKIDHDGDEISIVFAGSSQSGKTAIIERFADGKFALDYSATAAGGHVHEHGVRYQGKKYTLKIVDTPDTRGLFRENTYKFVNYGIDRKDGKDDSMDVLIVLIDDMDNWKEQMRLQIKKYQDLVFQIVSSATPPVIAHKRISIVFVLPKADICCKIKSVEYLCFSKPMSFCCV